MSGIPVYTQSPISAAKPTGVTPQTATSGQPSRTTGPQSVEATTTKLPTSAYPPAQPGAGPPAPTAAAAAAQRYAPLQPTPTTTTQNDGPPAPQPGAFPTPTTKSVVPPPPKVGETYHPPRQSSYQPPQMNIPPPTFAYGSQVPSSSTSTSTAPSSSYPVGISTTEYGGERRSLEHPPGYQQNTHAADLTPDQRRAQEAQNNSLSFGLPTSSDSTGGFEDEGIWSTTRKWAAQAGDKLQSVEAEVWKKINKQ